MAARAQITDKPCIRERRQGLSMQGASENQILHGESRGCGLPWQEG